MSLPDIPPLPQQATPERWAQWEREMRHAEAVMRRAHVEAQQQTNTLGLGLNPAPLTGRARLESLAWSLLCHQPHVTGMTELQAVDAAVRLADAFVRRFPDAAE